MAYRRGKGAKVETTELKQKILALRRRGLSFAKIGEELGYAGNYCHRLCADALKSIVYEDAHALRILESERLDEMYTNVMGVLEDEHYLVNAGCIVYQEIPDLDEDGNKQYDEDTGELLTLMVPMKDTAPILQSVDRLLKIMERRAKLMGLDKPVKVAHTDPTGEKEATSKKELTEEELAAELEKRGLPTDVMGAGDAGK